MQKKAINDLKNFKGNRFVPEEFRNVLGDLVASSADPLNDLIDQAQARAREDIKSFSQVEN